MVKDVWAAECRKDRLQRFLEILKGYNGQPVLKALAWAETQLGITRATALRYLETYKDLGWVLVDKGILTVEIKKGGN